MTFIERARVNTDNAVRGGRQYPAFLYLGYQRLLRVVGGIEVVGPYDATNYYRTPAQRKLFICEPEEPDQERACAERIAANLAENAFRRPVTQADIDRLMGFYDAGRDGGGFDAGVELIVSAVLVSPDFLYRGVAPPQLVVGGEVHDGETPAGYVHESESLAARQSPASAAHPGPFHELTDLELASRLSFFLWAQGPDEELLELAAANRLRSPGVLEAQVMRMLAAPQAETLVTIFAFDWLNRDDLYEVQPDRQLFAEFSPELRAEIETEIGLFLRSVLLEDRNVQELLSADYTFLNQRLAKHYGIDSVRGPQFRRVTLENEARRGLLGKGAVLLRTSYGDRYERAQPVEAHPTETFYSDGETLIDGERVEYGHLLQAHTDGDIYVYFRDANVLAAGDAVSPTGDPQLDWFGGGWLGGRVEALEKLLQMSDAETRIVPGRGPVVGRAEVQAEFEMCLVLFDRMLEWVRKGMNARDMLDEGLMDGLNRSFSDPYRFAHDAYKGFWAHRNTLAADVL